MKKSNWKKYVTSAAVVALVGTGVAGITQIDFQKLGANVGDIEAAPVAAPINIIAFDQFAITGSKYDPLGSVSAFGVLSGEMVNLSQSIEVTKNTVNINEPGRYEVTYQATNELGQTATKTVNVVVDINPAETLTNFIVALEDIENATKGLDVYDEALQTQIDALRKTAEDLQKDFDGIAGVIEDKDTDIGLLKDRLLPLQGRLDGLYEGTVTLYTNISELKESVAVHKALADAELARLEQQLDQETANHEKTVAALEKQIKEAGDGDQVKALQKEVDASIARFEALEKRITERIAEVTAELPNLDKEAGKIEGRDEIVQKLIDRNEAEIDDVEKQIEEVKTEREAILKALQEKVDSKLDGAQLEKAKTDLASAETYFAEREKSLNDRVTSLTDQTKALSDEDAAYANRIKQMRSQLDALRNREREIEERITKELNMKDDFADMIEDVVEDGNPAIVDDVVEEIVGGDVVVLPESPAEVMPEDGQTDAPTDDANADTPVVDEADPESSTPTPTPDGEPVPDTTPAPETPVVDEDAATPVPAPKPDVDEPAVTEPSVPTTEDGQPVGTGPDSDVIVGGEDLGENHEVLDEIPTLEEMMEGEDNVEVLSASVEEGEGILPVPDPKDDAATYTETEYSAGAGESVIVDTQTTEDDSTAPKSTSDAKSETTDEGAVALTADGEASDVKNKGLVLPQTGAAYGAVGLAGTSGLAGIVAWIIKRRRK